ncbi:MAG TPA: class I SAM-dependent methyltransferase [Caldilineaceae bacterium]|nr:class I SAM-dependent methyltransferase [Caldilineaceae bacterium]
MRRDAQLREYYEQLYAERDRLGRREGKLEQARTQELLGRFLPTPPARIIDIGGGTGSYASWLAALGYEVHLVDIVPAHVQAAAQAGISSAVVGDARALPAPDAYYDVALLLGPLYHLLTAAERLAALREARRVVQPAGLVVAAFISRGAVALDGYVKGWIDRPGVILAFRDHVRTGVSLAHGSGFGAIAYFHLPSEARAELVSAGLEVLSLFGVEGPGWVAADFDDRWQRVEGRQVILESARICEEEPELQALSPHLLAFTRRP